MCNRCVTFYDNARFGMMSICSDISIGASVASLGALAPWLATLGWSLASRRLERAIAAQGGAILRVIS